MFRSRQVPSHSHTAYDIQALGLCRACDDFHERSGITVDDLDAALSRALDEHRSQDILRILSITRRVAPERHAEYVAWFGNGIALADAVDEAMEPAARDLGLTQ